LKTSVDEVEYSFDFDSFLPYIRPMYFVISFILLMGIWVVFSGLFDPFHLSLGVISCLIVSMLSSRILFPNSKLPLQVFIGRSFRFFGYLGWLIKEIVIANVHVFYLAIIPGGIRHLDPELVRVNVKLQGETARYLLANSITLTPGTVSVKIQGNDLLVHSISRKTTEGLKGDMENRIARIFGETLIS
jgi:multicomponent Na+:H+ antiporter subunit E